MSTPDSPVTHYEFAGEIPPDLHLEASGITGLSQQVADDAMAAIDLGTESMSDLASAVVAAITEDPRVLDQLVGVLVGNDTFMNSLVVRAVEKVEEEIDPEKLQQDETDGHDPWGEWWVDQDDLPDTTDNVQAVSWTNLAQMVVAGSHGERTQGGDKITESWQKELVILDWKDFSGMRFRGTWSVLVWREVNLTGADFRGVDFNYITIGEGTTLKWARFRRKQIENLWKDAKKFMRELKRLGAVIEG